MKSNMPESTARTDYWREAESGLTLTDYPEIDDASVAFPDTVHIAYAVYHKGCGHREFIVDGSTQICYYCGKMMFRTAVKLYQPQQ